MVAWFLSSRLSTFLQFSSQLLHHKLNEGIIFYFIFKINLHTQSAIFIISENSGQ